MRRECPRSEAVAAAVAGGGRFDDGSGDLHVHVAGCQSCSDLVLVMSSLRSEWDMSRRAATVPSAGLVWWRAQLRQRQAAQRKATAPVAVAHAIALTLVLALAGFLAWSFGGAMVVSAFAVTLPALPSWFDAPAAVAAGASPFVRYTLLFVATASLVLGPTALYLALRRD